MNKRLHKSLERYNKSKEDTVTPISGTLGIPLGGQKLVEVPNRQGFVYVKLKDNTSEVIQAYNSSVSNTYDLPVLVIRSNNIYRVLGRNLDLYRDWGNIPYLPKHGGQHSFNPMLSMGADITWIYSQQIMPLLGYPSGTDGSPRISVAPYLVQDLSGNWKYVGNTGTISTTIYNPNTGSRAVMALVYLDTVSGNPYLLVNSGTYISESLTGTNQVAPYIPQLTNPNHIPITAIRLLSGTSTLTWNNLYDARPFLRVVPTGSSGLIIQDEGILKGTVTTLNVVGTNADISVSGSVARLFITGSTGGSINPPITGSIVYQDDGVTLGSALILNFRGGLLALASGTTAELDVSLEHGESVLSSAIVLTGTAGVFQNTGLSVTLPVAGTYNIDANVRASLRGGSGTTWWMVTQLYNSTDNVAITNSERLVCLTSVTGQLFQMTSPTHITIDIPTSKVITVYAARDGLGGPSWLASTIETNTAGRTTLSYEKIG